LYVLYHFLLVVASGFKICYDVLHKGGIYMGDNRGLKNRIAISNAVDKELYARLKEYSEKTSVPVSKLLDKAISMLLESVDK